MVNDVSGLGYDANLANVAAKAKVPVILMHSRDNPQTMQNAPHYLDVVAEVKSELTAQITLARSMNITNIYADVGIGFAKTAEHNWQLLKNHSSFLDLGVPLVLGISRKSFLGKLFNIDEPSDRDIVTALLHSLLLDSGAKIIRVHNVFHLSALRLLQRTLLSSET
jgi:dihydropteroate synthase